LVVPAEAADADGARLPDGIELVDEDDARRLRLRLLEEVAHTGRADADEHLDELRAADREERRPGLARDGAGKERLPGAGRSDQEHALRDLRPEAAVALGVAQEVDDLLQLRLGLLDAGDVAEARLDVLLAVDAGAVLSEHQRRAGTATQASRHEAPYEHHHGDRQHPAEEEGAPDVVLDTAAE